MPAPPHQRASTLAAARLLLDLMVDLPPAEALALLDRLDQSFADLRTELQSELHEEPTAHIPESR